jgi:antitoxin component YwqK of YwqJK toxin-antitoxin module
MQKQILTFLLFLAAFRGISQDTTYLNIINQKVSKAEDWETFKIVVHQEGDPVERIYYKNGQIKTETPFSDYTNHIYHGISREWFKNGLLCAEVPYKKWCIGWYFKNFLAFRST